MALASRMPRPCSSSRFCGLWFFARREQPLDFLSVARVEFSFFEEMRDQSLGGTIKDMVQQLAEQARGSSRLAHLGRPEKSARPARTFDKALVQHDLQHG